MESLIDALIDAHAPKQAFYRVLYFRKHNLNWLKIIMGYTVVRLSLPKIFYFTYWWSRTSYSVFHAALGKHIYSYTAILYNDLSNGMSNFQTITSVQAGACLMPLGQKVLVL